MTIILFLSVSGRRELPFAGYSVVSLPRRSAERAGGFFEKFFEKIVWDDRQCDEAWLITALHIAGPQATSFPVVIGAGFHPFPFRTRKLSLPPPMVLHA